MIDLLGDCVEMRLMSFQARLVTLKSTFCNCQSFPQIFVDEMESESELREVVTGVLGGGSSMKLSTAVVEFYLNARALAGKGELYDGANSRAHYNLR